MIHPHFFASSGPSPPSGTLTLPAPLVPQPLPAPQPFQPLPIQPATTPGSPMQVDPANVPLPPTTERTPDDQLWLPSDATALYQPPLVIHMQPPGQQHYSQALGGEPISPERSAQRATPIPLSHVQRTRSPSCLYQTHLPYGRHQRKPITSRRVTSLTLGTQYPLDPITVTRS